jgi:lipopolysaccharide export system permease protein
VKIVTKYILREHLGPLTFALTALTSLLLLNYIAKRFGDLVGKGLPAHVIAEVFALSVPFTVAMTLPMAVLVATLYAFSRIAAENEITAFKASGVSMPRLMVPVLVAASTLSLLMVVFNDQVLPRANHRLSTLLTAIGRTKPTFLLEPQVMNDIGGNGLFLRAGKVDQTNHTMRDVVIYDLTNPAGRRTIFADSGALAFAANQRDLLITLHDGHMQEVKVNKPEQLQRIYFETQHLRMREVSEQYTQSTQPNGYKSDREMTICEMQAAYEQARGDWRVAQVEFDRALALTYSRPLPRTPLPAEPRTGPAGLGGLYCRAAASLFSVKTANAAELPAPIAMRPQSQPPQWQPPQDSAARRRAADSTARAAAQDSARRAARPAAPSPVPVQTPPATPPVTPAPTGQPPVTPSAVPPGGHPSDGVRLSTPVPTAGTPALPAVPLPPAPAATPIPSTVTVGAPSATALGSGVAATGLLDIARLRLSDSRNAMYGYAVEIQKKFALAVACVVFVLLGAPIALRFPRGGVGLVLGVSLGVFALYYCGLIAGETLANKGIVPASISMWGANILFTLVGLVLLARMGRESGSARGGGIGEAVSDFFARFRRRRSAA